MAKVEELSPAEKDQIISLLKGAWQAVGAELLNPESGSVESMTRDEVFEVTADHIEMFAYRQEQRNLCKKFFIQKGSVKRELKERAFPFSVYSY